MVQNPFRPGAGQPPLYLAGRSRETDQFQQMLTQTPVYRNLILTGLRGVGKTVLLDGFKPHAQSTGWLWTGNDLTESASLSEERIATRLVTDLSSLLGPILAKQSEQMSFGFARENKKSEMPLSFRDLWNVYESAPGLTADKLKALLFKVRDMLRGSGVKGIVFAYDEAQNMSDRAKDKEYPLSVLLDVFAAVQKTHHPVQILLVLTGLPTLLPRLNEARTFSERMFDTIVLSQLSYEDSCLAITKPVEISGSPLRFSDQTIDDIYAMSVGYPYFIQYICKETFDAWISQIGKGEIPKIERESIVAKLDQDFFAHRWDRATDRQQEFMQVISSLETAEAEFTTQEIVAESKRSLSKGFSASHATQILSALIEKGLVYRNKHGKYSFAVPLMAAFIRRQTFQGISLA